MLLDVEHYPPYMMYALLEAHCNELLIIAQLFTDELRKHFRVEFVLTGVKSWIPDISVFAPAFMQSSGSLHHTVIFKQ